MSISVSKVQQHHIDQLLTTAATGNGVVNDVDALLTPMQVTKPVTMAQRYESRPERNLWRTEEIHQMLSIMQKYNAIELLNDKTVKSEKVFRNIEEMMYKNGYRKKSHVQIWTKWKFLKSTYTTSRRSGTVPRMIPPPIYDILHKMLGNNSASSECNHSLDGDSSNGVTNGGTRLVISGVEGSYTNGKEAGDEEEDDSGFGMAHPIFGFRLGLVKQEPADTGYETITINDANNSNNSLDTAPLQNNSARDSSTSQIQFRTEIKQEPTEEEAATIVVPQSAQEKLPPECAALSSLNSAVVTTTALPVARPLQMPPLRIAPFAKEPSVSNALQASMDRPPPPLSMHRLPVGRPPRMQVPQTAGGSVTISSISGNKLGHNAMQRKILPKTQMPQTIITPVRLPKEISVQQPKSAAASVSNTPRLKHVPTRKIPYSLRPERMLTELDPIPPTPLAYQEPPTTSRQALNTGTSSMQGMPPIRNLAGLQNAGAAVEARKRKRRLDIPWVESAVTNSADVAPVKPRRLGEAHKQSKQFRLGNVQPADDDNEDEDVARAQRESFKAAQQNATPQTGMRAGAKNGSFKSAAHNEHEFYENALRDLGTSLRQMQREMITEFFEQQMELARKEHVFQMKQDVLIMQAFEEQTRHIMKTAREMLGLDLQDLTVGSGNANSDKRKPRKEAKNVPTNIDTAEKVQKRLENNAADVLKNINQLTVKRVKNSNTPPTTRVEENSDEVTELISAQHMGTEQAQEQNIYAEELNGAATEERKGRYGYLQEGNHTEADERNESFESAELPDEAENSFVEDGEEEHEVDEDNDEDTEDENEVEDGDGDADEDGDEEEEGEEHGACNEEQNLDNTSEAQQLGSSEL